MYWKNNVEAFRYYLVLKSGQFQLRLCLLYTYPKGELYAIIKRGTIVLLLLGGQSRASMQ